MGGTIDREIGKRKDGGMSVQMYELMSERLDGR